MESFRTVLLPKNAEKIISLKTPVVTIGSCFSDAIGRRMQANKFSISVNRFGTLYNPISIHEKLRFSEIELQEGLVERENTWFHYDYHSELFASQQSELIQKIKTERSAFDQFLKNASVVLLTYGTAWIYRRKETGKIVANCHKIPSSNFHKELLSVDEIAGDFQSLFANLRKINPSLRIILTVSPVRHIKDTLELNNLSKSILRLASHEIASSHQNIEYYPAFEIMMDDLRDYRFYKSDMLHPTEEAEDYIWSHFQQSYMDDNTQKFINEWGDILKALRHKPFQPNSLSHRQFLEKLRARILHYEGLIDVTQEVQLIDSQL